MTGEITHIAMVQLYGWIHNEDDTDKAVRARAFASLPDAVAWCKREVEAAHGEEASVTRDRGGAMITSPGGPTWGFVLDVTHIGRES
jgi:hypothetical protein